MGSPGDNVHKPSLLCALSLLCSQDDHSLQTRSVSGEFLSGPSLSWPVRAAVEHLGLALTDTSFGHSSELLLPVNYASASDLFLDKHGSVITERTCNMSLYQCKTQTLHKKSNGI